MVPMPLARVLPSPRPTSGIPASKTTKISEMRSRCLPLTAPLAPMAAATAKESRPSGW